LIREYEDIIRLSDRPKEKLRAKRGKEEQWGLIEAYLHEYLALAGPNVPDDIGQILQHREQARQRTSKSPPRPLSMFSSTLRIVPLRFVSVVLSLLVVLVLSVGVVSGIIDWPPVRPPTAAPAPDTPTIAPPPTPRKTGDASFQDEFDPDKPRHWSVGEDDHGRSWYGDGGYNVLSRDSKRAWIWVMPERHAGGESKSFTDAIIEVDATPITDGRLTGYGLVFGWTEEYDNDNDSYNYSYYKFEVKPNGDCGFLEIVKQIPERDWMSWTCPLPVRDTTVRIRLEIKDRVMVAFLDSQYVARQEIASYEGGLIGLSTYCGGESGSNIKSQVRFDNLIVWPHSPD
jgi:hypothetical protein